MTPGESESHLNNVMVTALYHLKEFKTFRQQKQLFLLVDSMAAVLAACIEGAASEGQESLMQVKVANYVERAVETAKRKLELRELQKRGGRGESQT